MKRKGGGEGEAERSLSQTYARGTSLIGKSVRDFFRTKGIIRIFDGFFLKTKGFLPKLYEIFGSEMPLGLTVFRFTYLGNSSVHR